MASEHPEVQLQREFADYQTISLLEKLARENPNLVAEFFNNRDGASVASAMHEHNRRRGDALKAAVKPATKSAPAAKPNGRRPAFDENGDTTRRVKEILRQR
jgi:hypothetical protein